MSALLFLLLPACAPEIQPDPAGCPARNAWYLDANGDGVADGTDVYVGCEAPGDEWILTPPFGFVPTDTDTSAPTTTDTSAPTTTDSSAPTTTDTSVPTATDTSAPTTTDSSVPTTTDTSVPTTTDTSLPTGTGATP